MERRELFRKGSGALVFILTGCNRQPDQNTTTSKRRTAREPEAVTTETASTTIKKERQQTETQRTTTTGLSEPEIEYSLGETHTHQEWEITVTDFKLRDTFRTDAGTKYSAPPEKKLSITTVEISNQSSKRRSWAGMPFAVIFEGRIYQDRRGFKHPEFDGYVSMDDIESIKHARQYAPEMYPLASGETAKIWGLFLVPSQASKDVSSIGFDGSADDGILYPIRWYDT